MGRSQLWIAWVCFALALLFYASAVLRLDFHHTNFLDLDPHPDGIEYFAQAKSLLRDGKPAIQIGAEKLPSRYPPGYPALMLPWLTVLPDGGTLAPFRTNQTIGLLLLAGGFAFYLRIGRPLLGGVACLILATQPAFVTYSRASLSDLSGAATAVLAFALVYLGLKRDRRGPIYAAANVLGLSLLLRAQLVFFAPLLISMTMAGRGRSYLNRFIHCLAAVLVFFAASSPYFLFNWVEFGHPLKTGYDFWVPFFTDHGLPFSWHNLIPQLSMLGAEATASWDQFRVAHLFGSGTYFVPAFVLLVLVGLLFCRPSRFTGSAFLAGAAFFVPTASYAFVDGRFFLPLQFLLVAVAALPAAWALDLMHSRRQLYWRIPILLLFFLTCAGYPSRSGFPPKKNRSQTSDAMRYRCDFQISPRFEATVAFAKAFGGKPGILLSNINPAFLNALLPKEFQAAPINEIHDFMYSRLWRYGRPEALQLAQQGVAQQKPVYALIVPSPSSHDSGPLPEVPGYSWKPSLISFPGAAVMTLEPGPQESFSPLFSDRSPSPAP